MNDLSQAFASALFFRILLPGLVIVIGVHPLISNLPNARSLDGIYPGGDGALFLAEVMAFGLIAYAGSTPIYHVAQGLILPWLTGLARRFNTWRFDRTYEAFVETYGEKRYSELDPKSAQKAQRLFVYLSDYPIERDADSTPRFVVRHATRVGNITATYERYPDTRYLINAERYWEHFLFLVPGEIRKELDSVQAIAVGTLLSAAAGWVFLALFTVLGLARIAHEYLHVTLGRAPIPDAAIIALAIYGLGVAILFNYLARVVHREYSRLFRACFDVYVARFAKWLDTHQWPLSSLQAETAESFRVYSSALDNASSEGLQ